MQHYYKHKIKNLNKKIDLIEFGEITTKITKTYFTLYISSSVEARIKKNQKY